MSQTPFVGKTVYPSWGGQEPRVTVATPSWIAPPLPVPRFAACEAPPIRLSVLPEEGAHVHAPIAAAPAAPEPPAYPDLRLEHAAVEAECAALRIQLKATADAMVELRRRILEASEPEVVGLACAVGERIAGRELRMDPEIAVGWAREAIERLASDGSLVVAISPDIAAALEDAAWAPVRTESVRIETDATLGVGSCEVRGPYASVDASLAGRAEATRRDVGGSTT